MEIDEDIKPLSANRKRAASSPPPAETAQEETQINTARARFTSDLDDLGLIPMDQAWDIDLDAILEYADEENAVAGAEQWPSGRMDGVSSAMMSNLRSLSKDIIVLCVLGNMDGQYWLLRALLPVLRTAELGVRAYVVANDVAERQRKLFATESLTRSWAYLGPRTGHDDDESNAVAIPFVQPSSPTRTFTRLGLLHPLGGGREPLDAIVLLDGRGYECKRRLVLPFGWGAGRHVQDDAGGWMVRGRLMEILRESVEQVAREQRDAG